jgi:hypothetical protein
MQFADIVAGPMWPAFCLSFLEDRAGKKRERKRGIRGIREIGNDGLKEIESVSVVGK